MESLYRIVLDILFDEAEEMARNSVFHSRACFVSFK